MKYINPLINTTHTLHDSEGQLRCHAISGSCLVLNIGDPEFMCVFMEEVVAMDLIDQILDALVDMRRRQTNAY